jgi:hypothetical protein
MNVGPATCASAAGRGVIWSEERPSCERCMATARAALGEAAFAAAWAEGRAMPLDEAVAYALEEETPDENVLQVWPGALTGPRLKGTMDAG